MSLAITFFCPGPVHPVIWAQWQREFWCLKKHIRTEQHNGGMGNA